MKLWSIIYAVGAVQALLLCLALRGQSAHRAARQVLGLWLLIIAVDLAGKAWYVYRPVDTRFAWTAWSGFLPFVYGALFYLYVRAFIHDRRLRWRDAVHALGFLVAVGLNADLFLLDAQGVHALHQQFVEGRPPARFAWVDLALLSYSLSYVIAACWLTLRHLTQNPEANRVWLWAMLCSQALIWLVALAQWGLQDSGLEHWHIYFAVVGWVVLFGYLSLLGLPHKVNWSTQQQRHNDPRYPALQQRLKALMHTRALHRQANLTIADVAKASGYPEYLISQWLNHVKQQNFREYINRLRIDDACQLLRDPRNSDGILEIAYTCGFNSKSTFNQAFKAITGQTPRAHRLSATDPGAASASTPLPPSD